MPKAIQADLDKVARRGRKLFRPGFTLYYAPLGRPTKPRIVISQKVDKKSVVRHKIKRQIRHILHGQPLGKMGLVIIVNQSILKMSFAQISSAVRSAVSSLL